MRPQLVFALVLVSGCSLTSCDDKKLAFAGPVKEVAPGKLSGAFQIVNAAGGVESNNLGGACIVVSMNELPGYENMKCTGANRECAPGPPGMLWKTWYTYCDLPDNAEAGDVGQCWGKPVNRPEPLQGQMERQYCNRSKDYNPAHVWQVGADNRANREDLDRTHPVLAGLKQPSHWRISACIVRLDGSLKCQWGPITEMP